MKITLRIWKIQHKHGKCEGILVKIKIGMRSRELRIWKRLRE